MNIEREEKMIGWGESAVLNIPVELIRPPVYGQEINMVNKQVIFDKNYIEDKRKSVQSTFMSWLRQNLKYADESGFSIDNVTVNFSVSEKYDEMCKKRTFRHTSAPVDLKNVKIDFEQLKMLLD